MHNANWKADYLANVVEISEATLHLNMVGDGGESRWDPVVFSYCPLKGTASLTVPAACDRVGGCPAHFEMQFGNLDAATVQTAMLGAHEKGTLLSALLNRLHPSSKPGWPQVEGTVKAGSLTLGPVTLKDGVAVLHLTANGAEITSLDASMLGGTVHGAGTLTTGDKPAYSLTGDFKKLSPAAVGQMLGGNWRGGTFEANGNLDLSGYAGKDLASSAKGALHFEWKHGAVAGTVPPVLSRFDRWTVDAAIANGKLTLGQNEVVQGGHKRAVDAAVTLAEPPKASFTMPKPTQGKKR
jgi:hypothetical protein